AAACRVDEDVILSDSGSPYLGSSHRDDEHPSSQPAVCVCSWRLQAGNDLEECVLWQVLRWRIRCMCPIVGSLDPLPRKQQRRKPCSAPAISSKARSSP